MDRNKSGNDFVKQAGILAVAGIISRVIGLLYRSPLHSVIGDRGMGYYNSAYSFYSIILLISSYSIPSAISKVIAQKLAVREYRNAHRVFKCALAYVLVVGAVAGLFLFFCAGVFVVPEAVPVLRIFAPTIFIYGILGVLRGYFQAHKSMVQTSTSQIFEQIVNATVSIGAAYLLIRSAFGSLEIPAEASQMTERAVRGAMGSAMGTGAGVVAALLFMLGMYLLNKKLIDRRIRGDRHEREDSYGVILKMITMIVTPFILSTAIYNLSGTVNTMIYTKLYPVMKDVGTLDIMSRWGIFSNQPLTISNIPIAFASAMASAMIPSIAQLVAANRQDEAREKIGVAVKSTMVISIPCAVGLFALAKPITNLLFPTNSPEVLQTAAALLMTLCISVVFFALSTLNSSILQGLGKVNIPIINAAIALVVQSAVSIVLLRFTGLDLYSVAIANTLYSGGMCVLNQLAVKRAIGYRQEVLYTFGVTTFASVGMGACAWAVYEGMLLLTESPRIAVLPAILAAVMIYFMLMILFRGLKEEELRNFPKGYLLVRFARKCRLIR